ncbi:MAG: N-formylglutamate amidohydrolase [Alphaproteobacteria bacterium]|nr:N-formylglutamate amidohydrolase [Alphaproteobacteria bacterium]MCB9974573.1 N-formylglutamate amidohydrolase [Rhodospirillales bacterium]
MNLQKPEQTFILENADAPVPLIFESSHSGLLYPDDFRYACPFPELERMEDRYVEDLFSAAPDHGAALLHALYARSYIDLNRAADDIDPNLLEGEWPHETHGPARPTARSDAGIGLISRLIKPGLPVYTRSLNADEILHRIMHYYRPYHTALESLIETAHYRFGAVWHISCHSMPASSATPRRAPKLVGNRILPSDFVLGNRDGTTCGPEFVHAAQSFLKQQGFRVTINDPYKGVELIQRYSQPTRGRHSLQIEINRSLFMDEASGEKTEKYLNIKGKIADFIEFLSVYCRNNLTSVAAD